MKFYAITLSLLLSAGCCRTVLAGILVHQAKNLVRELSTSRPSTCDFDLTAMVSYVGNANGAILFTLEDETGSVVAFTQQDAKDDVPRPGDVLRCLGTIRNEPQHRRRAFIRKWTFVSRKTPPMPLQADILGLLDGRYDFHFVSLSGTVYDARTSETNPNWTLLTLADETAAVNVSLWTPAECAPSCTDLIGGVIAIKGVCTPHESGPRKHLGKTIAAYGMSSLRILKPESGNRSDLPDIETLSNLSADKIPLFRRYRVSGTVSAVWDGQALITTDSNDLVRVNFLKSELPKFGQRIEAVGFPETDLFHVNLTQATWKEPPLPKDAETHPAPPPVIPFDLSPSNTQRSRFHGKAIRVCGTLLALPRQGNEEKILYIQSQNQVVSVYTGPTEDLHSDLAVGCKIEVTGICILDSERWNPNLVYPKVRGFIVVTRTPDDIHIIARPPWWTPIRLLSVIGTLLAIIVAVFLWNVALRRVAARKGRELFKEQLGHVKADLRTEERTRLAVELHDTLAQNLTGVSMEIEAANDLRGDAPQPMLDHLGIAAKALKSCRDELRNCLWDLRSQALEEPDMTKAVLKTLQPVVNDSRLAVRFNMPRARLSDNTAHALLRVIRELVVNAIRHGNASAIKVAGTIDNGKLLCSVTDNGCGFDPDAAPGVLQGHFGLQGIQERIDEIGGTFKISSAPGKGTKATISVAIPREH